MMKGKLLFIVCLWGVFAFAQEYTREINTGFAEQINHVFHHIEKKRVPHGLLQDYAFEFTELSAYNGIVVDSNAVHVGTYQEIYNTLFMAQIREGVPGMFSPEEFRDRWNKERKLQNMDNGDIPHIVLSGLYFKYSALDKDALEEGRIMVEGKQLYDVYKNGQWQNPYEEREVFAVTTPVMAVKGLEIDVSLPENLFYTNTDEEGKLSIDFADGNGYQNISFKEVKRVKYGEEGIYNWRFRLTLKNVQERYAHTYFALEAYTPIPPGQCIGPPVKITATKQYLGIAGSATIQIRDSGCDGIRKPLIVAEGFDPAILVPELTYGMNNIENFISSTNWGNLPNTLAEYDIIYVNWDDSFAHIQRNAYVLEEVIQWVNENKIGNEPNVVLGQSMGGLVARYALRDMEKHDKDHDTRLYISHDAPHQGANVPVGLQYMDRHIYNQFIQSPLLPNIVIAINSGAAVLHDLQTVIDAPSARQMLKNHVQSNYAIDNTWHNTWQTDLRDMGYPEQTRNIAISNGNHCAYPQPFDPGEELFSLEGNVKSGWLSDILLTSFPYFNNTIWSGVAGITFEPSFLLGILPGNNRMDMDFWYKALPVNQQQIYRGKITYTKKLLWLVPITGTITNKNFNSPSNTLPYDYYTGGSFETPIDFEDEEYSNMFYNYNITASLEDSFSFIPTPSSLDIGEGYATLTDTDYKHVYTVANPPLPQKPIPFDNYTTSYTLSSSLNEQHLSFNTRNGNWLADELSGEQPVANCSFACGNITMSGPSFICNSPVVFSVPQGAGSYNWQIQNSSVVNLQSETTENSITLSRKNGNNGWVTVTAIIDGGSCGSTSVSKNVYVGAPIVGSIEEVSVAQTGHILPIAPIMGCDDFGLKLHFVTSFADVQDMEWEKLSSNFQWSQNVPGNSNEYVVITPRCNGPIKFRVRMKNSCGWSDWQELEYNVTQCSSNCSTNPSEGAISSDTFDIWPVPATTTLNVKIRGEETGFLKAGETLNIKIFNNLSVLVKNVDAVATQTTIDVSNLPSGTYTLLLTYNGVPESHQIIIG